MKRNRQEENNWEVKRLLHFLLRVTNHKFYEAVFPENTAADPDAVGSSTYTVDDLAGIERLLDNWKSVKRISQADIPKDEESWGKWK